MESRQPDTLRRLFGPAIDEFRANRADQPEPVAQVVVVDHGHPTPPQWWRCSKWRAHKEGTPPDVG